MYKWKKNSASSYGLLVVPCRSGLCASVMYRYALYSYGLYSYGLCSYGLVQVEFVRQCDATQRLQMEHGKPARWWLPARSCPQKAKQLWPAWQFKVSAAVGHKGSVCPSVDLPACPSYRLSVRLPGRWAVWLRVRQQLARQSVWINSRFRTRHRWQSSPTAPACG